MNPSSQQKFCLLLCQGTCLPYRYKNVRSKFWSSSCVIHLSPSSSSSFRLLLMFPRLVSSQISVICILLLFMPRSWMRSNVSHDSCLQLSFHCSTNTLPFTSFFYPSCNTCINLHPFDTVINFPYDSIINPLRKRLDNETFLARERQFMTKASLTVPVMEQTP